MVSSTKISFIKANFPDYRLKKFKKNKIEKLNPFTPLILLFVNIFFFKKRNAKLISEMQIIFKALLRLYYFDFCYKYLFSYAYKER